MKMQQKCAIFLGAIITTVFAFTACSAATGAGNDTVISISVISGVTLPSLGGVPVTGITETEEFTGTIIWSDSPANFAASTVYTATITLSPKAGFTLIGVPANSFSVAGAASVSNDADSGVITAIFPATEAASVNVSFSGAIQSGGVSGTTDSTALVLTFDTNPSTLTADDITLIGAAKGDLSGSGMSRTLSISNITVANGATVSVEITSPSGFSISGSPKTAVVYRSPYVGMPYQGGILAYIFESGDTGYIPGETHGLIAATEDNEAVEWITGGTTQTTANSGTSIEVGTGQANTIAMMNQTGFTGGAAKVCDDYVNADTGTGVYSDWYLPSKNELLKLRNNKTAIGGFKLIGTSVYWSSSEDSVSTAYSVTFGVNVVLPRDKDYLALIRAVRTF